MKKILLIATGGTIASKRTENGLAPLISSAELLSYVPGAGSFCSIDTMQILNIDSTNISPEHWLLMAKTIEEHYGSYDGFVICHGTDTMAYTSAALSYLIQESRKPIVITGAQRPIDMEITDAKTNLLDSLIYASDDASFGVSLVFDGKVIIGTRARKMKTKSYNAFDSINYPVMAIIQDGKIIRYIRETCEREYPLFYHNLNRRVFVLKLIPGINADIFDYLEGRYDGVIIESFGVGGLPDHEYNAFYNRLEKWVHNGNVAVMTTQVLHEGSDMTIYQVGHRIKRDLRIMESFDMTLESTVTKLMWILGETNDIKKISALFHQEINHDMLIV